MSRAPGRPKSADVSEALIRATRDLLLEEGFENMSVDALVKRAETTRPAFYRRYRGLADVVLQMLLNEFGTNLDRTFDFGDLNADLLAVQRDQLALFTDPMVKQALAGFFAQLHSHHDLRVAFMDGFLLPRREATGAILHRAVQRGQITADFDVDWICDLLTGPFIMRVLLPEVGALDDALVYASVASALAALGYHPPTGSEPVRLP